MIVALLNIVHMFAIMDRYDSNVIKFNPYILTPRSAANLEHSLKFVRQQHFVIHTHLEQ